MLISFEGIDTSGKTTQATLLYTVLKSMGIEATYVKVPGATPASRKIYEVIKKGETDRETEVKLFLAAISDIDYSIVQPLRRKQVVILDRWFYSTLAYQGYGYGFSTVDIWKLIDHYRISEPDLNFFMRIDLPATSIKNRIDSLHLNPDKFESQPPEFFEEIQNGFGVLLPVETTHTLSSLNSVIDNFNLIYDWVNFSSKSVMPVNRKPTVEQLQKLIENVKGQ